MERLIEQAGSTISNNITKKSTYVRTGEEAVSKLQKAEKLGIRVIDEAELNALIHR